MNKKNIVLVILLVLICLIGGIGIGFVMSNKTKQNNIIDNNKEDINDNINNETENNDNKVEIDNNEKPNKNLLSVSEFIDNQCWTENGSICNGAIDEKVAINLINKFRHTTGILMYDLSKDSKNDIAALNAIGKNGLCQNYFDLNKSNCYENDKIKIIKYNDLLNMKKKLFGEQSTLERKDFNTSPFPGYYKYLSDSDSFVFSGYEAKGYSFSDVVGILRTETTNDKLFIAAYSIEQDDGLNYDIYTYGYTFKKGNNNYYLEEITQLTFDNLK